jgi:hypothetical protein
VISKVTIDYRAMVTFRIGYCGHRPGAHPAIPAAANEGLVTPVIGVIIRSSQAQERMDAMKFAWICFWISLAAVEVGLAAWSHSTTFLWIGSVAPFMVAFNLQRHARAVARRLVKAAA